MKKKQEEFDEVSKLKDSLLEEKNVELKRIAANAHYKRYLEAVVAQNEDAAFASEAIAMAPPTSVRSTPKGARPMTMVLV